MTSNMVIDPCEMGFRDLDDLQIADALICSLDLEKVGHRLTLDLRRCYVDYHPCSIIIGKIVEVLAQKDGEKLIDVWTTVDLGNDGHYGELFFRRTTIVETEPGDDVITLATEYCRNKKISLVIHIYELDYVETGHGPRKKVVVIDGR